jgi:hypothetical protein
MKTELTRIPLGARNIALADTAGAIKVIDFIQRDQRENQRRQKEARPNHPERTSRTSFIVESTFPYVALDAEGS